MLRNIIEGMQGGRRNEAGNGVSVWNAPDVTIAENSFRYGRDGIFTISSRKDRFINNRFEQVRFAVHYMYTNDSEVSGNVSIGNHVGYAIMYLEPADHPQQYQRSRPRLRHAVQLRQLRRDRRQLGERRLAR